MRPSAAVRCVLSALCLAAAAAAQGTWRKINPPGFNQVDRLLVAADGAVTVTSDGIGAIYRSTDQGRTWSVKADLLSGGAVFKVLNALVPMAFKSHLVLHPSGDLFLIGAYVDAGIKSALFHSADGGANWTAVGDSFGTPAPASLDCTPGGDLLLGFPAATQAAVAAYKLSKDRGKTWEDAGTFAAVNHAAVDPEGWIYVVGNKAASNKQVLYRSKDGGKAWDSLWIMKPLGLSGTIQGLSADRKGGVLMSLDNSGMAALVPGKDTVIWGAYGTSGGQASAMALTADFRAVAGFAGSGVLFSDKDLRGFEKSNAGLQDTSNVRILRFDKDENLYAVSGQNLYVLKEGGTGSRFRLAAPPRKVPAGMVWADPAGRIVKVTHGLPAAGIRLRIR